MISFPVRLANAAALATAVLWILCAGFVALLPGLAWQITTWWMHGMNLSVMGGWQLTWVNFFWGGLTLTASGWLTGLVSGWAWRKVS